MSPPPPPPPPPSPAGLLLLLLLTVAGALHTPRRASKSLLRTFTHGDDIVARSDMALTSLFGGISLANAKLGSVHGFAGVLGGMFDGRQTRESPRSLPFP